MKTISPHLLLGFLWLSFLDCYGQFATNTSFSAGRTDSLGVTKYFISYDLKSQHKNIPCQVKVKITMGVKGERFFYLKELTGDAGNLVYPGDKKEIVWDYVKELVHFDGKIDLAIEVSPSVKVPSKIKKRKKIPVELAPIYEPNKTYAIKIFREEKELARLNDIMLIENKLSVELPRKTKAKRKYQLAITDGTNTYFSNTFKVKRKVGWGWKLLPFLGAGAYYGLLTYLEANEELPGPPKPN